jgi:integrase
MAYAEKRDDKLTGYWYGEALVKDKRFRRRFETKKLAEGYEVFVRLTGEEPPTIAGSNASGRTFKQVAEECRDAGGPKGKWKRGRDRSTLQRLAWLIERLGHLDIADITTRVLEDDVVKRLERSPVKKGIQMTAGTINRYLTVASAVLHFAFDRDYIVKRPKVPLQHEVNKARDVLTSFDQDEAILGVMEGRGEHVEATCVRVLVETGLREGELVYQLRREQIEIETAEDQSENGWINLAGDQTKNIEARRVYIRPDLARELRAIMARGPLPNEARLLKCFKRACQTCGYSDNLVIHSLRHTRNTRLRKQGVDIKIRMTMLGHKTVTTSMRYDHIDTADQLEAAKKVENARGDRPQNVGPGVVVELKKSA